MSPDNHDSDSQQRIEKLKTELRMAQQRREIQRQEIAQKFGSEFLAVLDGSPNAREHVSPVVEKLVFTKCAKALSFLFPMA